MSDPNYPETPETHETSEAPESTESFNQLLSEYEHSHARLREDGGKQLEGTVVAVTADSVLLDIGYKSEGILPLADFQSKGEEAKPGDKLLVSVKGRDADGYYELSRTKISRPKDWSALERAFTEKATIVGTVTAVVKGGLSVDVGVRAFMPASRSGTRDAAELEKMVGQEIRCRITKLDVTDEDVVVDRRAIAEEEERAGKERRYSEVKEGDTVQGTVRSITEYGAFVDLGGVDALLHISDIAWSRINKPEDVLTVGQEIEAKVLKVDTEKQRISLGMKQLLPHPWDSVPEKYKTGDRVRGAVSRIADFGAFVELEPGVEGLVHISEMSWGKKVRTPSDMVKPGEVVEVVILGVKLDERRMSLGIKQTLGDPWSDAGQRFAVGSAIEGTVTSLPKFGAFVQLSDGVEGMIHVSEISAEKRINHPQEVLKVGQTVKAQVIAVDTEKRLIRLSMKQLVPSSLDEYLVEHKVGDLVTGRLTEASGGVARVELGEGVFATCPITADAKPAQVASNNAKADVSSLGSMLSARWKGSAAGTAAKPEAARAGQIRSFRITGIDPGGKKIELELA
jgi:small subunit ribosomal protein S1